MAYNHCIIKLQSDDLNWTYATSPALKDTDLVRQMPDDERCTPQVRKIFELLVQTHPNYGEFQILPQFDWGIARKLDQPTSGSREIQQVVIREEVRIEVGLGALVKKTVRKLLK